MKSFIYILFIFITALAACTGQHRELTDALNRADRIVCELPDSALRILCSVDTAGAPDGLRAHFGLLLTKAATKMAVKTPVKWPDSVLIKFSVDYYSPRCDSFRVQSAFYYGEYLSDHQHYKEAVSVLAEAYDIAVDNGDIFYQAMIARELATVYHWMLMADENIEWARIAREKFIRAGKPLHATWMLCDIAEALNISHRAEEALKELALVDTTLMVSDPNFRHLVMRTLSNSYLYTDSFDKAVGCRLKILDESGLFRSPDWAKLAECYYHLDKIDLAHDALEKARALRSHTRDSLYVTYLDARFAERLPDAGSAYRLAMKWADDFARTLDTRISKPQTTYLIDYLSAKSSEREAQARQIRTVFVFWCVIFVLLIVLLIMLALYLRYKIRQKSDSENRLCSAVLELEENIRKSRLDNSELKLALQSLFKHNFSNLDSLCQIWWDSSVNNKLSFKESAIRSLRDLQSAETIGRIIALIDRYCDNWFSRFRNDVPDLQDAQYRLAVYLFVGFSTETIAVLTDKSSPNAVFSAKSRLRQSIIRSCPASANIYLADLSLKRRSPSDEDQR